MYHVDIIAIEMSWYTILLFVEKKKDSWLGINVTGKFVMYYYLDLTSCNRNVILHYYVCWKYSWHISKIYNKGKFVIST